MLRGERNVLLRIECPKLHHARSDNHSLPDYLEALAGWLADCVGFYANRGIPVQWNGWQVVQTAMKAATVYE